MASDFAFVSTWSVACSRDELWDVLEQLLATSDPMIWWPSLDVTGYDGRTMSVRARSGLGYALDFVMDDLETHRPDALTFSATGDLRGTGVVTIRELGADACAMDIDWRVAADRGWIRRSAWLLRPVFVAGHHLVMRRGEKHFNRWLAARG